MAVTAKSPKTVSASISVAVAVFRGLDRTEIQTGQVTGGHADDPAAASQNTEARAEKSAMRHSRNTRTATAGL